MDLVTDQLNATISTGVTSNDFWNSVSGGMDKVSASSMGFAWGIGSSKVWICQVPCSGDWKTVEVAGVPLDITTDDIQVYVLYKDSLQKLHLAMKSASNTDDWLIVDAPDGITSIVSTASYIWGQALTSKFKLPKPGTTGNWIPVNDSGNIRITSASSKSLYGVDSTGVAMKTDESLQSGWAGITDFVGSAFQSIVGDADQTALYGVDTKNQVKRCVSGKCDTVLTQGYVPQSLTVEPISKQLWMTSTTPSESGNIFMKSENNDYSQILQATQPLEKDRDDIVVEAQKQYNDDTNAGMLYRQLTNIKEILVRTFNISPEAKVRNDTQTKKLGDSISDITNEINQMQQSMPVLHNILLLLLAVIGVYIVFGFLGFIAHIIALIVLVAGTIYFLRQ